MGTSADAKCGNTHTRTQKGSDQSSVRKKEKRMKKKQSFLLAKIQFISTKKKPPVNDLDGGCEWLMSMQQAAQLGCTPRGSNQAASTFQKSSPHRQ
jgi:hypothetical protein